MIGAIKGQLIPEVTQLGFVDWNSYLGYLSSPSIVFLALINPQVSCFL